MDGMEILDEVLPDNEEIIPHEEEVETKGEDKPKLEEEKELEEDPGPIHSRPALKDIKEKFPTIFKDFPELKSAFFREQEYTKIYPTVEDARSAKENSEVYNVLASDITEGDGTKFIEALKDTGDLGGFAAKFLENLQEEDSDTHFRVVAPYLDKAIKVMYARGVKLGNENMQNAAEYFADFLFGNPDFATKEEYNGIKVANKDSKQDEREQRWINERNQEFSNSTNTDIVSSAISEISAGIPDTVKPAVKNMIVKEVLSRVDKILSQDRTHIEYMNSLWQKATKEGLTPAARTRIKSAYLARASKVISSTRRELVAEALGVTKESVDKMQQTVKSISDRKEPGTSGKPGMMNGKVSPKSINWNKTSPLDFLDDKITLKK